MALTFQVPPNVADHVLEKMKASRIVHPDATFNLQAPAGLRKEVAYRDLDFLDRLGHTPLEEQIIDAAMHLLRQRSLVACDADYDRQAFDLLRKELKEKFVARAWTSVSPVMERLFFMLTSVKRPRVLIELGSFWGNTLAWFAGPCIGPKPTYSPAKIYGIDIDEKMTQLARENFARLQNVEAVELIAEDARTVLERLEGPFDFVYIEAKKPGEGSLYLPLLKQIYSKLPKGAWVMAHDATRYTFRDELKEYVEFVRDRSNFAESISFDIDAFGLELSIK